jgi:hypothetical protein
MRALVQVLLVAAGLAAPAAAGTPSRDLAVAGEGGAVAAVFLDFDGARERGRRGRAVYFGNPYGWPRIWQLMMRCAVLTSI